MDPEFSREMEVRVMHQGGTRTWMVVSPGRMEAVTRGKEVG